MKLNIVVMFGGESVEHEVSIISAKQAIEALDKEKYNVIPVYISKNRQFYYGDSLQDINNYRDLNALVNKTTQVTFVKQDNQVTLVAVKKKFWQKEITTVDLVIPVVHGTNGEDGTLQGYLEMLKIPYAGCNVCSAAIGQDKVIMKEIFTQHQLPITPWFYLYGHEFNDHQQEYLKKAQEIGYPVILKPANLGSSVGIVVAHNDEEFIAGVHEASRYDFKVVVEQMVTNLKEVNCSVLGSIFKAEASILEEVAADSEILSFAGKYQNNSATKGTGSKGMASAARIIPANLSYEKTKEIQDLALKVFKILGASGVCRIDFMLNSETNQVYVNEINTVPGSLAFYLWAKGNKDFTRLMDDLVDIALLRYRKQEKMIFSYDTNLLQTYSASATKGSKC